MRSLAELLELACQRGGHEVVLETGQPAIVTTPRGGETMGNEIGEDELIGLLTAVVSSEQQVELAVGNAIEFALRTSGGVWSLVTEPGMEGILVRARRNETQGAKVAVGVSHHPKLYRQESFGTRLSVTTPESEQFDPTGDTPAQGLEIDLGLELSFSVEDDDDSTVPATSSSPEFAAGTFVPAERDDSEEIRFDTIDDDDRVGVNENASQEPNNPVDLSEDSDGFADFGRALQVEMNAQKRSTGAKPYQERSPVEVQVPGKESDAIPVGIPSFIDDTKDYGPSRANASSGQGSSQSSIAAVTEGALCLVLASDIPVTIIDAMELAQMWIRNEDTTVECNKRLNDFPPGSCIVIDVEDPSQWLSWLLRRLEEGYRGFVVSRAKSFAGAKRILLGTHATQVTEKWLNRIETIGVRWGINGMESEDINQP